MGTFLVKTGRRILVSVLLIAAVLSAGTASAWWLYAHRIVAEEGEVENDRPLVEVRTVRARDVQRVFTGYGSARADVQVTLAAEVGGEIVEVADGLKDGSAVRQGQTVLRIDAREYQQRLIRAQSMVADLEAQAERLEVEKRNIERLAAIAEGELQVNREEQRRLTELFERDQASKKEYDFSRLAYQRSLREWQTLSNQVELITPRRSSMAASIQAQKADAELASIRLGHCRIAAPFDGMVERIMVEVGDRVLPGNPLLRIVDPNRIEVPIELQVSARPHVVVGARSLLRVDSMPDVVWEGSVSRISPVADARSRTFSLYVEVDNRSYAVPLIPGYFVSAKIEGPMLRQVLAVPRGAVANDHIFEAYEETARRRAIVVEHLIGDLAVVSGELEPGIRLILTNLDILYDGAPVRITESEEASEENPWIVWRSGSAKIGTVR